MLSLVEEIARRGHEVGHHGYMHEPPGYLDPEQEKEILEKGIDTQGDHRRGPHWVTGRPVGS